MRKQIFNSRQMLAFQKSLAMLKVNLTAAKMRTEEVHYYLCPNKRHAQRQISKYKRWISALDKISDIQLRDRA